MKRTRKSIFGRVAATLVAAALLASMTAVPAFATDEDGGETATPPVGNHSTSIDVQKIVTTDGNTYAPATSFQFTVANGEAGAAPAGGTALQGVTGGLKGTTITSSPETGEDKDTAASYTFNGKLETDASVFKGPGIYHYTVSETKGSYEGIDYSDESYDVYVYVVNGDTSATYKVDGVIAYKAGSTDKASNLSFTNDYGKNNNTTHDVTVTKQITGNMSVTTDKFNFTVGVSGASGEAYKVVYTTGNGVDTHTTFVTSGNTIKISDISNNDTIRIYGLSASDTYTVTEDKDSLNGYTVTDNKDTTDDGVVSGQATEDGQSYTVTNDKTASTPTGIIMNIAPYALLVVVALGAGCIFFVRKRREA